uniref:Uncharacterized protein n=1 Tax=Rhizophora mucronata TaxID=61149 RepID=A0A2P2PMP8_RHIMU
MQFVNSTPPQNTIGVLPYVIVP